MHRPKLGLGLLLLVVGSSAQQLRAVVTDISLQQKDLLSVEHSRGQDQHRELKSSGSIVDIAQNDPSTFSLLLAALDVAGLDTLLDCEWFCFFRHFTVFAPTDNAFGRLPEEIVNKLVTNIEYRFHLISVLSYHVLARQLDAAAIQSAVGDNANNQATVKTLLGVDINATLGTDGGVILNGNTNVIQADIEADNGVVHVIDNVLLPTFMTNTIAQVATDAGIFTQLIDALDNELVETLSNDAATFTVFAPTDEAFTAFTDAFTGELTTELLRNIVLYHVIPDQILFLGELLPGRTITTAQGEDIDLTTSGFWWHRQLQLNGDVSIEAADILASNGIVHAIDKVLLPPTLQLAGPSIVDVVSGTADFSTLVRAIVAADLVDTLSAPGNFTVFAPTNAAFEALGTTLDDLINNENKEPLRQILLYHVVPAKAHFSDLEDDSTLTTAQGSAIAVELRYFLWFVTGARLNGDARITDRNIEASNGVIHVIDKVLIPPSE
jgi:transforming growth factor-beta-induced protein